MENGAISLHFVCVCSCIQYTVGTNNTDPANKARTFLHIFWWPGQHDFKGSFKGKDMFLRLRIEQSLE